MAKPKNSQFWQSAKYNNANYMQYFNRLTELSISMFDWKNLPETIDQRFMELALFGDGMCVFFYEKDVGYLALRTMIGGHLNVYQIPTERVAYASNGVNVPLNETNSVIIFNNMLHTNSMLDVEVFAERLYKLDRIIDVNTNAQKTPVLITCEENQRLTMKNLYMKYDGNEPVIFADKNLSPNALKVLNTEAPFISDKIYDLKTKYWNEALTYLGISNTNSVKKERMTLTEATKEQGGIIASRYSRLEARRYACEQINNMFGLDIWCDYREDFQVVSTEEDTIIGEPDSDGEGGEINE